MASRLPSFDYFTMLGNPAAENDRHRETRERKGGGCPFYPDGLAWVIRTKTLSSPLCGQSRPTIVHQAPFSLSLFLVALTN